MNRGPAPCRELVVECVPHEAVRYACERWHYSRAVPNGKVAAHGVFECGRFRGIVAYGHGSNRNMARPYGLAMHEAAELTRIALDGHSHPLTTILARSVRLLHREQPGLRLIVSYADPGEGHLGGVYQAASWLYLGEARSQGGYEPAVRLSDGTVLHPRAARKKGWRAHPDWIRENVDAGAVAVPLHAKHRYAMPLDRAMRRQLRPLALPYPRGDIRPRWEPCPSCCGRLDVPGGRDSKPSTAVAGTESQDWGQLLFPGI